MRHTRRSRGEPRNGQNDFHGHLEHPRDISNVVPTGILVVERGRLVGYGQLDVIAGAVPVDLATCPDHRDRRGLSRASQPFLRPLGVHLVSAADTNREVEDEGDGSIVR